MGIMLIFRYILELVDLKERGIVSFKINRDDAEVVTYLIDVPLLLMHLTKIKQVRCR